MLLFGLCTGEGNAAGREDYVHEDHLLLLKCLILVEMLHPTLVTALLALV